MKIKPIAVAIAAALPISTLAATLADHTGNDVSAEFVALNKVVSGIAPSVTLGASYSAGDIITFTFNQPPKLAASSVVAPADATKAYAWPLTETIDGLATPGALGLVGSTDTSVSYRVTSIAQDLTASPPRVGTITLPDNIRFFPAGDVTYTTSSSTANGTAIDAGKTAAGEASSILYDIGPSQFAATVGGLSKTISVEKARKEFTTGTTQTVTVAVNYNVGSPSPAYAVDPRTATLVLDGDFSWIDTNTATSATGVQGGVTVAGGGTATVGVDGTRITITGIPENAGGNAINGTVITLTNSKKLTIPVQTIAATVTATYNSGSVAVPGATPALTTNVTSSATASGAYKLDGSTVTVFAIPTSASVSNFIWLSNTGKTDGDVAITIYDGGKTHELGVVGTSKAGSEFDVTAAMNAGLEAKGITLSGGRVHMDIVTNAPGKDIAVSAAYRVGDDRVNLVTSLEAPRS